MECYEFLMDSNSRIFEIMTSLWNQYRFNEIVLKLSAVNFKVEICTQFLITSSFVHFIISFTLYTHRIHV